MYYTTAGDLHYCDTERGGKDIVVRSDKEKKTETVELVVKMPKEDYDLLMSGRFFIYGAKGNGKTITSEIMKSICTGKLLPKGHGDLIDRNELVVDHTSYDWDDYVSVEQIKNAEAVVEADKEEEEE